MSAPFSKLTCVGALPPAMPTGEVPLARELQHLIRSIPKEASGDALVRFMQDGYELSGRRAKIARGMLQYGSSEADLARKALGMAISNPGRIDLTDFKKTYGPGTAQRAAAVKLVTTAVAAASQDIGRAGVKARAMRQIPGLLKKSAEETLPTVETAGTIALILAAGYGLATFASRH